MPGVRRRQLGRFSGFECMPTYQGNAPGHTLFMIRTCTDFPVNIVSKSAVITLQRFPHL